jgi:hypothetical protein
MWCKRTQNPHPDYSYETIPTKIFTSKKGRKVELCYSCFENEKDISKEDDILFKKNLDLKLESLKLLNI